MSDLRLGAGAGAERARLAGHGQPHGLADDRPVPAGGRPLPAWIDRRARGRTPPDPHLRVVVLPFGTYGATRWRFAGCNDAPASRAQRAGASPRLSIRKGSCRPRAAAGTDPLRP